MLMWAFGVSLNKGTVSREAYLGVRISSFVVGRVSLAFCLFTKYDPCFSSPDTNDVLWMWSVVNPFFSGFSSN